MRSRWPMQVSAGFRAGACAFASFSLWIGACAAARGELASRITSPVDGAPMSLVPAGPFVMGSNEGDADEQFAHRVDLPAFYIDMHEVTIEQYARFVAATGYAAPIDWPGGRAKPGCERLPVTSVTWYDAASYATWAGKRLPTEAEWEKAARGTDGRAYPWGNSWKDGIANLEGDTSVAKPVAALQAVGSSADNASPYGVLDMIGNAWEWTSSWYEPYAGSSDVDAAYGQKFKVIRGGGAIYYYGVPPVRRCSDRYRCLPYGRFEGIGFRCAMDATAAADAQSQTSPLTRPCLPPVPVERRSDSAPAEPLLLRVENSADVPRRGEIVTSGVPFPRGFVPDADRLRLFDDGEQAVPLQAAVIGTWPDGSAKWILLDFPVDLGARQTRAYRLRWSTDVPRPIVARPVEVKQDGQTVVLSSGSVKVIVDRKDPAALSQFWTLGVDGDARQLTARTLVPEIVAMDSVPRHPALPTRPSPYTPAGRVKGLLEIKADAHGYRTIIGPDWMTVPLDLAVRPPDDVFLETQGLLRVVLRADGWITDKDDRRFLRYTHRLTMTAGSDLVRVATTFTNLADSKMLWVRAARLITEVLAGATSRPCVFGGSPLSHEIGLDCFAAGRRSESILTQSTDVRYDVRVDGAEAGSGCRAPGWVDVGDVTLHVRHFWQQFPKRLTVAATPHTADESSRKPSALVSMDLWAGDEPLDLDQGMAKTHEVCLAVRNSTASGPETSARVDRPLFAVAPASWYCGSGALGELAPFDFGAAPTYESALEAGLAEQSLRTVHGFRDFGDEYFPGGYKGAYAFVNMEYDIPHGFLSQFARTGLTKYLRAADVQVRHQADIDVNHKLGQFWKHSPRHSTYENPDFGHVFLRGLIDHYHFTGDRRSRETAIEIGDWVVPRIPKKFISGRCVGWSLLSLAALYEATWDEKYRNALNTGLDALLEQADPRGCFAADTDSITFFLGIQAAGCIAAAEAAGHDRMRDYVPRLLDRILGTPIEYSGRTLSALAWGVRHTGDARYLDCAERTLERVLQHNRRLGAANTCFTQHYLAFRRRSGLDQAGSRVPALSAEQCCLENGLYRRFIPTGRARLFLEDAAGEAFDLIVIGHNGRAAASARVYDDRGQQWISRDFSPGNNVTFESTLTIPAGSPGTRVLRIELDCPDIEAWDLLTTRPMRTVWHAPKTVGLDRYPARLFFRVLPGTAGLEFAVDVEKEQFHGLVVLDSAGHAVAAMRRFIDLPDKSRHRHFVTIQVPPGQDGQLWSIELRDVQLAGVRGGRPRGQADRTGNMFEEMPGMGILPYFAPSPQAWFNPERADRDAANEN